MAALAEAEQKGVVLEDDADRDKFEIGPVGTPEAGDDRFDTFVKWLEDGGSIFPKLYLKWHAPGVRGVHSSDAIEEEEDIVQIPYKQLITVEMGKETPIGQKILQAGLEFDAPKHIFLMIYMMQDRLSGESYFQPYYDILPKNLGNMPIFWGEEELAFLDGSYLQTQVQLRKNSIRRDYENICRVAPSFSEFSLEEFMWSRMIVCSRNFGGDVNGVRTSALVPFADMLNHYRPRETKWTFDNERESFVITSLDALQPGRAVYDSYGKKCQHRFLLNYGFSVEDNCEEDGKNPNEIQTNWALDPNDKLFKVKSMFLSGSTRRSARLNTLYCEKATKETFSWLRCVYTNEAEFMQLCQHVGTPEKFDPCAILKQPFTIRNEMQVLRTISRWMSQKLSEYPTTLEEDKALLASNTLQPFSNKRNSIIYLIGEKEICAFYIALFDTCVRLLLMDWSELLVEVREKYNNCTAEHYDGTSYYITNVVVPLVKRKSAQMNVRRCAVCSKPEQPEKKLLRCVRCKSATYCSRACQRLAWKEHKKTCGGGAGAIVAAAGAAGGAKKKGKKGKRGKGKQ